MPRAGYSLDELVVSGFRAYLQPQAFDFTKQPSLAVFAPNGYGKSSLVDALEFLFSEDGTLSRLGLRAVHNQAGVAALAHNLASERNIPSTVRARFKLGGDASDGERLASGPNRARPDTISAVVSKLQVCPIVRGYALRSFVESQTAEERYEEVAGWLQMDPLVQAQRSFRALRQAVRALVESQDEMRLINTQLERETRGALKVWNGEAVVAFCNGLIGPLDHTLELAALDSGDPVYVELCRRAEVEDKAIGLDGLRQIVRSAAAVYTPPAGASEDAKLPSGHLANFLVKIGEAQAAEESEAKERAVAANAVFESLWRVAEPLFKDEGKAPTTCPICATPIVESPVQSVAGVREHLARHRAEVAQYARAKAAADAARADLRATRIELIAGLKALGPLVQSGDAGLHADLESALKAVDESQAGAPQVLLALSVRLTDLLSSTQRRIQEIEARQGESTYRKVIGQLDNLADLRKRLILEARTKGELGLLAIALDEQSVFVSGEIRKQVQALLDSLRGPVGDFYQQMQPNGAAAVRLELPPEDDRIQQRLLLEVDFAHNRPGVQPSGYLSDSQVHSLALALRLAAIRQFNVGAPFVVLDDIVTSYDADHRRAIAALLAMEFTGMQVLVVTHDERFFSFLKDQLPLRDWQFLRIVKFERDYGPRFATHKVGDALIEERWARGESAANDMRQAEEEWLLGICREFGVDVRIRALERAYNYERSELAGALAGFLRSRKLEPPAVPGVNNRFLASLQQGVVENLGSHFSDAPYGDGSMGDEQTRWKEFAYFRSQFVCPQCKRSRFQRPVSLDKPVCAHPGCEAQFAFAPAPPPAVPPVGGNTG